MFDMKKFRALSPEEQERIALRSYEVALPFMQADERRWLREKLGVKPKGRMPLDSKKRRDAKVFVRLNEDELAAIREVAESEQTSLADALRTLALEAAYDRKTLDAAAKN